MKIFARALTGVSVLAVTQAMGVATAAAQEVGSAEAAALNNGDIIVTAQRRNERLQDVPISISVVGGEALADNAIQNASELSARLPNFVMNRTPGGINVTMRGVGSSTATPSLEQSIVTFVDGIYGGNNRQFRGTFLDIERIEVLRGPQGALVGKNTVAGAINILTKRPTDEFEGYLNGNYDFLLDGPTVEGAMNVPLGNGFAMRVAGRYTDVEGYVFNELTHRDEPTQKEYVGRITLGFDNGGPVTAFLKYEHSEADGVGNNMQVWAPSRPGYELDYRKRAIIAGQEEVSDFNTDSLVAQFDFDLDWATVSSITGYTGFSARDALDADWTDRAVGFSDRTIELDQFSQELRLVSSSDGNFDYAAGALFQTADLLDAGGLAILPAPTTSTLSIMKQNARDISIYGQAGYNFGPFRIQGSLRYSNVRKTANYKRIQGVQSLAGIGNTVRNFDSELENDLWDPSIVLQYRPNSRIMLYASYQQGSKSGGFQGGISNAEAFSFVILPEKAHSYEVGAKFSFAGGSYFNVTGFHTTYNDLQVSTAILGPDGLSAPFFVGNAATARVIGVEVDSLVRITPEFELSFNGAWNPEAKYVSFRSAPCHDNGVVAPPGDRPGSCNVSGLRLPYSPKLQANATATYKQPIGDSLLFTASGTAFYRGEDRRAAIDGAFYYYQDAFVKLEARVAIGSADGRWELGLIGRNLTNEMTKDTVGGGGFARGAAGLATPDAHTVTLAPPRQILVTGSVKF